MRLHKPGTVGLRARLSLYTVSFVVGLCLAIWLAGPIDDAPHAGAPAAGSAHDRGTPPADAALGSPTRGEVPLPLQPNASTVERPSPNGGSIMIPGTKTRSVFI
jgi:hypothetical protein